MSNISPTASKEKKENVPVSRDSVDERVDSASIASSDQKRYASTSASHRKLERFHVNLIAIGGTVGTALFINMGTGLTSGGPASLLIAYLWWTSVICAIAECQLELVTFWPTDIGFARNAGRYVDEALGFATGWNFYLYQQALTIFEVTAFGLVLGFWQETLKVNAAVFITIVIVLYTALNIWTARGFANAEFCLAMGKVLLIIGLLLYTFIAMLGGNPGKDRFGFRYWNNPGAFTSPYPEHARSTGIFEGWFACVVNASFTVAGPDYLTIVAGEARNPRKVMPKAFKATIYRLVVFFIGSALAIGILVPYNDPNLLGAQASDAPGGAKSPYVISMQRLAIPVLPSIVNALILTSVFSAGNAFLFCSSRTLAQMGRDGQAPKLFSKRNRNGVPFIAVGIVLTLCLVAYCQVSSSASIVITYLTGLVGSAQLVGWIVMSGTWIRWNAGLKAQGISRDTLPARSRFQPFAAWYAFISAIVVTFFQGYNVFLKNHWDTPTFIFAYFAPVMFIVLFCAWKIIKKTRWEHAATMDVTSYVNDPEFTEYVNYDELEHRGKFGTALNKTLKAVF
ncbi:putative carnitine transport protein [Leucosporidium creatinivorum]|uniref:Putative carnitine transport protein n=1 Tax=Leucosporidium creatinivorum TaxID=106004 RepID=A0A1Y2G4R0_9BASI|nr:putative carnitine transport protein [Leucosporidium creatinivorum]